MDGERPFTADFFCFFGSRRLLSLLPMTFPHQEGKISSIHSEV